MPPSTLHSADRESARATTEWEMRELLLASRVLQRAIRACLSIDAALREQLKREPRPPPLPPPANPKHVTPSPSPCAGPGPGASRVYHYTLPFSATSCSAIARGHSVPDSSARKPDARATLRAHFAQLDIALAAMLNEQLARASAVE